MASTLQGLEADQRAGEVAERAQDLDAPLVADLQAPVAHQPRQRPLHHVPVAARLVARLDATPSDPWGDPTVIGLPQPSWRVGSSRQEMPVRSW
jgi:hypothetical protein